MDADALEGSREGQLPCAVQVGFAGSRRLYPPEYAGPTAPLDRQLVAQLSEHLRALPGRLGLAPRYFLCGISQVAVGADFAFTEACRALGIPQRVFLPQPADVYLTAVGSDGSPDFLPNERAAALQRLAAPSVIEQRVVTTAPTRRQRFEEVNQEIAAQSDVVVCLLRAGSTARPGGAAQLLALARERGIPALVLTLSVQDGRVRLAATWHDAAGFVPSALPAPLDKITAPGCAPAGDLPGRLPTVQQFAAAVKAYYSREAARQRQRFGLAAWAIIGTHLLATLAATVVLAGHGKVDPKNRTVV